MTRSSIGSGFALLLLAALLSTGCASSGMGGPRSTRRVVERATELTHEGDYDGALRLVRERLGGSSDPETGVVASFTVGWIHATRAHGLEGEERRAEESEAMAAYRAAIDAPPPADAGPDFARSAKVGASENLALLLRERGELAQAVVVLEEIPFEWKQPEHVLAVGDMLLELDRLPEASAVLKDAYAESPGDEDVADRLLFLYAQLDDGSPSELLELCTAFEQDELPDHALEGLELALAICAVDGSQAGLADLAFERWLRLSLERDLFTLDRFLLLPDLPDSTQAETAAFVASPGDPLSEDAGRWTAPGGRTRLILYVGILRSLSREAERAGEPAASLTLLDRAGQLLALCLEEEEEAEEEAGVAEEPEASDDVAEAEADEEEEEPAADPVLTALAVEVTLDQLLILTDHPSLEDDGTVDERIDRILEHPCLAPEAIAPLDPTLRQRFHTVVGLIYADRGWWVVGPATGADGTVVQPLWTSAPYHLERAVEAARQAQGLGPDSEPLPGLMRILAEGLEAAGRNQEALVAHTRAARGYHAQDEGRLAYNSYRRARDLGKGQEIESIQLVRDTRRQIGRGSLEWFPHRWYEPGWFLGAGIGVADANAKSSAMDEALARFGHVTNSDLDGTKPGGRIRAGYQFAGPVAVEIGWAEMGRIQSTIEITSISGTVPEFIDDLSAVHPVLAGGFTSGLRVNVLSTGRFTATTSAGLWWWSGDVEVMDPSSGSTIEFDRSGYDPYLGLGFLYALGRGFQLRGDFEAFYVDGEPTHLGTLGVQYGF